MLQFSSSVSVLILRSMELVRKKKIIVSVRLSSPRSRIKLFFGFLLQSQIDTLTFASKPIFHSNFFLLLCISNVQWFYRVQLDVIKALTIRWMDKNIISICILWCPCILSERENISRTLTWFAWPFSSTSPTQINLSATILASNSRFYFA